MRYIPYCVILARNHPSLANRVVVHSACGPRGGSRGLLFLVILHFLFLPSLFLILLPVNISFGSSYPIGHGHYIDYNLPCAGVISESAVALSRTEDWSHLCSGRLVRLGYLFIYLITYAHVYICGRMGRPLGKHVGHLDSLGGGA